MLTRYFSDSLALAEARLILAKLIWNFDFELDGDHDSWVDDARFYVSSISTYTAVLHVWAYYTDKSSGFVGTSAAQASYYTSSTVVDYASPFQDSP